MAAGLVLLPSVCSAQQRDPRWTLADPPSAPASCLVARLLAHRAKAAAARVSHLGEAHRDAAALLRRAREAWVSRGKRRVARLEMQPAVGVGRRAALARHLIVEVGARVELRLKERAQLARGEAVGGSLAVDNLARETILRELTTQAHLFEAAHLRKEGLQREGGAMVSTCMQGDA